ncbi:hypothetical protein [Erythrobacter sp. MTPC3]|uniref:hypothetical protein n=1 Tax=Erythrobacter sp. MTPC3 TaxID=3056564 RepID=UPI0036F36879
MSSTAHAQSGERKDSVGEDAVDAVTQPLSDLNLRNKEIPLILQLAQDQPYNLNEVEGCEALRTEVARLDEVLGPDADQPADRAGLINRGLRTGGNVLGGMIPFRGIVRQISGANAEEKRWEAAVYAGVARRSFLKGYMAGQGCETAEEATVRSAREILGMPED